MNFERKTASMSVIGSVALTAQGADIATTPIITIPADGLYLLSMYAVTTVSDAGASSSLHIEFNWTDPATTQSSVDFGIIDLTTLGSLGNSSQPVYLKSGHVLSYQTVSVGGTYGAAQYDLYISLILV